MPIAISKTWLITISIITFIACNSLFFTPGKDLPEVGNWFGEFSFDKLLHTILFFGMSFLFLAIPVVFYNKAITAKWLVFITTIFIVWAVATEIIQYFLIEGRSGSGMDALADIVGIILAFILIKNGLATKILKSRNVSN